MKKQNFQSFGKDITGIMAVIFNFYLQPCAWLDGQPVHFAPLMSIRARLWNSTFCSSR
jgi:hypothetical protein